jgi:hypothetical protein
MASIFFCVSEDPKCVCTCVCLCVRVCVREREMKKNKEVKA